MMPFPSNIRIEAAGRCNFRCVHCPVGTEGGRRDVLSYENFLRFFNALPAVPRTLIFNHGGEPLLNPDLEKMVHYAKSRGVITVLISTNTSLIPGRDLSEVDELRVSFDGNSPEENDATRIGGRFHRNAQAVRELAASDRCPKMIRVYNVHENRTPAPYLLEAFAGVPNIAFMADPRREWARVDNAPVFGNDATYCSGLFTTFTILTNGGVVMCCEDILGEDIVGNVHANTPLEIWERMEERRQAFARRDYPRLCQSCWIIGREKQ
jgi:radical SAM protein with 4Fe4S-binding SPASM domain